MVILSIIMQTLEIRIFEAEVNLKFNILWVNSQRDLFENSNLFWENSNAWIRLL